MLRASHTLLCQRVLREYVSKEQFCKGVPRCHVVEGNWKYVLLEVTGGKLKKDEIQYVVTQCPCGECAATPAKTCDRSCFHKQLATPTKDALQKRRYKVWMDGGGWITVDPAARTMHVHGISIAMGPADHTITRRLLGEAFPEYTVTCEDPEDD